MRTFLFGLLASFMVSMPAAQTINSHETIRLGIDLTLGMSEDAAIRKLTESGFKVRKHEPPDSMKRQGTTSMWFVDEPGDDRYAPSIGVNLFSSGRLATAVKELLPVEGDQVELGRQLYFVMRDLEEEGNSNCTIQTESKEIPQFAQKTARLHCGKKTIVIDLQKQQNKNETVQLNEELSGR